MPTWEEIAAHPKYTGAEQPKQIKTAITFFNQMSEASPKFQGLSFLERERKRRGFLNQNFPDIFPKMPEQQKRRGGFAGGFVSTALDEPAINIARLGETAGLVERGTVATISEHRRETAPDPGGAPEFVGAALGGSVASLPAIAGLAVASPIVLAYYSLQAGGQALRSIDEHERVTGRTVSPQARAVTAIGHAALTLFAERYALGALERLTRKVGLSATRAIGEAVRTGNAKALGKVLLNQVPKAQLRAAGIEASEEVVEQVGQNIIDQFTFDPSKDTFEGALTAAAGGAIGGLALGVAGTGIQIAKAAATSETEVTRGEAASREIERLIDKGILDPKKRPTEVKPEEQDAPLSDEDEKIAALNTKRDNAQNPKERDAADAEIERLERQKEDAVDIESREPGTFNTIEEKIEWLEDLFDESEDEVERRGIQTEVDRLLGLQSAEASKASVRKPETQAKYIEWLKGKLREARDAGDMEKADKFGEQLIAAEGAARELEETNEEDLQAPMAQETVDAALDDEVSDELEGTSKTARTMIQLQEESREAREEFDRLKRTGAIADVEETGAIEESEDVIVDTDEVRIIDSAKKDELGPVATEVMSVVTKAFGLKADEDIKRVNRIIKDMSEDEYGVFLDDIIYIADTLNNESISDKQKALSIGHEGAHMLIGILGPKDPVVIKGFKLLATKAARKKGESDEDYFMRLNDNLAEGISRALSEKVKSPTHVKLLNWLNEFWSRAKVMFDVAELGDIHSLLASEIMRGIRPDATQQKPKNMTEDEMDRFLDSQYGPQFRLVETADTPKDRLRKDYARTTPQGEVLQQLAVVENELNKLSPVRSGATTSGVRKRFEDKKAELESKLTGTPQFRTQEIAQSKLSIDAVLKSFELVQDNELINLESDNFWNRLQGKVSASEIEFLREVTKGLDSKRLKGSDFKDVMMQWAMPLQQGNVVESVQEWIVNLPPEIEQDNTAGIITANVSSATLEVLSIESAEYIKRINAGEDVESIEALSTDQKAFIKAIAPRLDTYMIQSMIQRALSSDYEGIKFSDSIPNAPTIDRLDSRYTNPIPYFRTQDAAALRDMIQEVEEPVRDKKPLLHNLFSPEWQAYRWQPRNEQEKKISTAVQNLTTGIIEAEMISENTTAKTFEFFNNIREKLTDEQEIQLVPAMDAIHKRDTKALAKFNTPVIKGAGNLIDYLHIARQLVQESKLEEIRKHAPRDLIAGIDDILTNQSSVEEAARRSGADMEELQELWTRYDDARNWGLDNYLPKIERGSYRLIDQDNRTRAIAVTRKDAVRKAESLFADKENPVTSLTLTSGFSSAETVKTSISRNAYFELVNRIGKDIDETDEDMRQTADAIRKAVGKAVRIVPTRKFWGPSHKRKGVLKGEENIFDILYGYARGLNKKLELDPVIDDARYVLPKLPEQWRKMIEKQLEYAKGKYPVSDQLFDNIIESILLDRGATGFTLEVKKLLRPVIEMTGLDKPMIATRAVNKIRYTEGTLKLGYRPVAAGINWAGGHSHTWVKVGGEYMKKGRQFMNSDAGKAFIKENEWAIGISMAHDIGGNIVRKIKLWLPLGMFAAPELGIRRLSLAANYLYAREKYGMGVDDASAFARRSLRFQNFVYNTTALPNILRSQGGKAIGQFKTYLIKEMEFIRSLEGVEIARYAGMQLILGGVKGFVHLLYTIPLLGWILRVPLDVDLDEWLNKNFPKASRGLVGLFGGDISIPATFQLPDRVEDWMGPFLSDMFKLQKSIKNGVETGFFPMEIKEWASGLAPSIYYWRMLIDSVIDDDGYIKDRQGRRIYRPTALEQIMLPLGVAPTKLKIIKEADRKIKDIQRKDRMKKQKATTQIVNWLVNNPSSVDTELPEWMNDAFSVHGIQPSQIEQRMEDMQMDTEMRSIVHSAILDRQWIVEYWQQFDVAPGTPVSPLR